MNDEIKLNLTTEETQIIINALANQPYQIVVDLIPKIINQVNPTNDPVGKLNPTNNK